MNKMQFSFLIFVLAIILTGCENFLAGRELKNILNEEIEYANAPESTIYIMADDVKQGTTYPNGAEKYKVYPKGKNSISFKVTSEYVFKYWEVVNKDTFSAVKDIIEIANPEAAETTFTYKTFTSVPVLIRPVCTIRPAISSQVPLENSENTKDTSIVITFSENLSEDIDLDAIQITSSGISVKEHYMDPVLNGTTITIAANLSNLISVPENKTKTITVSIPDSFFYMKDKEKISLASGKKWDFKINNNTSQKAEIIFSAAETQGTIIPYAANSYNIGETVDLSFEPKPGVRFLGWKILDSEGKDPEDSIAITGDKKEPKAKLSVLNSIKGVSISPITEIIPMVSGNVLPAFADSGVPAYSKISVNFITPMNSDDLNETFKYISITCDGHSITDKFQLPELSSDGKLLTIKPVAGEMEKLVTNAVAEITVTLHKEMRSTQTTESCLEEDFTWTYRINKETTDLVPPKIESISLKMNNVNGKTLTAENCALWVDNDYKQNHINDTLWVSCIGSDADSGVKTVKITETLLYAPDGTIVNKDIPNNLNGYGVFLERTPGNFTTEFAYKLCSPEDGIIQLDFVIYDNANLPSTTKKTFFVIKDTNIPVSYNIHNSDPASPEIITTNVTVDKVNDVWASNVKMTSKKYSTVFENSLSYGTSPAMLKPAAKTTDSSGNSVFSVQMNKTEDTILVYNTADEVGNSVSIERYIPKSPYIVKVEWDSSYKLTAGVDSDKSSSNSGINMCYRKQGDTSWKSDNNLRDITQGTQFEVAAYAYVKNGGTLYGTCSDLYDSSKTEDTYIARPTFTIDAVEPGPLNSGLTYLTVKLTSERNPEAKYFAMYNGVYYYLNFDSNNLAKFPYTVTSSTIRNGLTVIGVKGTKVVSSTVNYYTLPSSSDNDTTRPRLYYPPDNEEKSAKESLIKNAFSYDGNYLITYSFYDNGSALDGGGIKINLLDGKDSMPTLMKYLIVQTPDWTRSQGLQYSNLQKDLLSTLNNTSHSELSTYGFMSYNQKYTKYRFPNNYTYIPFSNSGYYVTAVPIKDIEDNTNLICDFICYDNNGNNSESTSIAWYGTVKTLAEKPTLSISGSNITITIKNEDTNNNSNFRYSIVAQKINPINSSETDYEWLTCRAYNTNGNLDNETNISTAKDDPYSTLIYDASNDQWKQTFTMSSITTDQLTGEGFTNSFIKVNVVAAKYAQYSTYKSFTNPEWQVTMDPAYSYPVYLYTGNNVCKSKNYQELHGKLQISHDRPCFVQTVCSAKDRGDNVDEWERRGEKLNKQYFFTESFKLSDYEPRLDDIPGGDYYRYIIHYADGSYQMTETKRK